MKKVFSYYISALFIATLLLSCGGDDTPGPEKTEGKAKMVLSLDMTVNGSPVSYLPPVSEKLLQGGAASLTNAIESYAATYVESYKNWLYVFSVGDVKLKRYSRQDNGTLLPDGEIVCSNNAGAMVTNMIIISDAKAYVSLMLDNKIIIFNPTTMQKTGEIDLAKPEYGVKGSSTPNPAGMIYRDGKVFVGCLQLTQLPLCNDGAYVIVINEANDKPEKMISDMRASSASFFNNEMHMDEKGDIYVNCWASYGYVESQVGGFLRIRKGETEFDPGYFFQVTKTPVGNDMLMSAYSSCYKGNGIVYMFGNNPKYISNPPDYVHDKSIEPFKIDLYNKTITRLDLPRTNNYSCSISKIGDIVYFGITSEANGSGLFTYNHKTGETSKAPVLNAPGTVMDVAIFD